MKAYPLDSRLQFQFTSDLTVCGKAALLKLGAEPVIQPVAAGGLARDTPSFLSRSNGVTSVRKNDVTRSPNHVSNGLEKP